MSIAGTVKIPLSTRRTFFFKPRQFVQAVMARFSWGRVLILIPPTSRFIRIADTLLAGLVPIDLVLGSPLFEDPTGDGKKKGEDGQNRSH